MFTRIIVTLNAVIYLVVIPVLEISSTHVYNPVWHGHARLHEVWQLTTHATLMVIALWLCWGQRTSVLAAVITLAVNGGFLFAWLVRDSYGGTMKHSDGSELLLAGINPACALLAVFSLLLAAGLTLEFRVGPQSTVG